MPISLLLEIRPTGAIPATENDWETYRKLKFGGVVRATIVRSKSEKALRFYWKAVELVAKGTGISKRPMSDELLIRTGYVETLRIQKTGEIHVWPRSIADMKHDEFCEFLEAAIELICKDYIAKTRGQFLKDIESLLNINYIDIKPERTK